MGIVALRAFVFSILPLLLAGVHTTVDGGSRDRERRLELFLLYLFGVGLGVGWPAIGAFLGVVVGLAASMIPRAADERFVDRSS